MAQHSGTSPPEFTLGDHIRKARVGAGLQQQEVAAKLGVSKQLVSRWERDQSSPDVHQQVRLARVLDAPWLTDLDKLPIAC